MSKQNDQYLDTPCKHCFFAEFDEDTQVGCGVNQIEAFKTFKPGQVVEVYDEEKEFFVIKNSRCLLFRNQAWAKDRKDHERKVFEEVKVPIHIIIKSNNDMENFKRTVNSIKKQADNLVAITVIRPIGCLLKIGEQRKILDKAKIPHWQMRNILNPDFNSREHYVDLSGAFTKTPYCCIIDIPYEFPSRFVKNMREAVIRGAVFSLVELPTGCFFSYVVYKYAKLSLTKEESQTWLDVLKQKKTVTYRQLEKDLKSF